MTRRGPLTWTPARLWRWRADRARDRRSWTEAGKNYERYLALAPSDGPIWIQLGHARKESGDLAAAREAYKRALELGGNAAEPQRHLAAIWTMERMAVASSAANGGGAARNARDWPAAVAAYAELLEAVPDDGPIWVQYGHALKEIGDLAGAMVAYRQAVAFEASEEDGRFQLACALRSQGQEAAARPHFARALRLAPRLEVYRAVNDQPALLAAAAPVSDDRCLVLDISDLLNFLGVHGAVTGIQRVQLELAKAILGSERLAESSAFDEIVFCFSEFGWPWALPPEELRELIGSVQTGEVDAARTLELLERIRVQARPCALASGSVYVVLGGFWGGAEVSYQRDRLRSMGVAFGVLTHDLFAITMPELCEEGVTASFEASLRAGLASWDFIIANSAFTAGDMAAFMARSGIGRLPVIALPLAHSLACSAVDAAAVASALPEDLRGQRFVLCVGTIEPRKNHGALIDAWTALGQTHPDLPQLVLVGRRGWRTDALVRRLESGGLAGARIKWLQQVSDRQLEALYGACLFTVFPSIAEGWGLPVGESLVHGKVCVTSNRTAMPEVGGRFAVYIDPHDTEDLRRAIEGLLYDGRTLARRQGLIRRAFRPRTWSDVADELVGGVSALELA